MRGRPTKLRLRLINALLALALVPGAAFSDTPPPGMPPPESGSITASSEVTLVEVPALAISSTDCRERVAAGAPIRYLVPDGVLEYVAKRGLYRDAVA